MAADIDRFTPSLDLNEFYHVLLEKRLLIGSCIVFTLFATDIYLITATPIYEATSTVEVLQMQHPVVDVDDKAQPDDYRSLDVMETVEGNLQKPGLVLKVLECPEVKANPYLAKLASDPQSPANERAFKGLLNSITVKLRRATRLIDINVDHRDPATAQMLANLLVSEYLSEGFLNQSGDYQNTSQFLTQEAEAVQEKLEKTETQLQDYAGLVDLRERILDERKQLDLLNERYLDKHPKVIEAHALLDSLQEKFLDEMDRRQAAEQAEGIIPSSESPDESGLTDDQKVEREMVAEESHYNVLTQEETTERAVYESVLDHLKEATISEGYQDANIRLVQPALLPLVPAKPRILLTLAIGLFLGCSIGSSSALMLSLSDSTIRTVDEAETKLKLPVIGAIPELRKDIVQKLEAKRRSIKGRITAKNQQLIYPMVMEDCRDSLVAESIRTLRASINLLGSQMGRKTFLITSAVPAEGKSFVTSNLGLALAQEGKRVLLIDADLRKPQMANIFGCSHEIPGLAEWLTGSKTLFEVIMTCASSSGVNTHLLLAGSIISNPAELLSQGGFQKLIDGLYDTYDYILVDSAPILAVGDTLLFSRFFQTTIMLVRAGQTPASATARAVQLLKNSGAKLTGLVVNRLPVRTGFGSNPYYYYYQNTDKYGEAYGTEVARSK
jgi:capsular exopolysaccharide synthesis family protein